VIAPGVHGTGVDRIGQDAPDGTLTPMRAATWTSHPKVGQILCQATQRVSFLQIGAKHLCHYGCFYLVEPHPCRIAWVSRVHTIAVGWTAPRQQGPRSVFLQTSASHPFGDQIPFVFGHHPTDLQEQLIMRILAHGAIHKFHPDLRLSRIPQ
jgi:hypothetical protein